MVSIDDKAVFTRNLWKPSKAPHGLFRCKPQYAQLHQQRHGLCRSLQNPREQEGTWFCGFLSKTSSKELSSCSWDTVEIVQGLPWELLLAVVVESQVQYAEVQLYGDQENCRFPLVNDRRWTPRMPHGSRPCIHEKSTRHVQVIHQPKGQTTEENVFLARNRLTEDTWPWVCVPLTRSREEELVRDKGCWT